MARTLRGVDGDRETEREAERLLWSRALGGEQESFGRVFDLHRERVFRHAYWLLGSAHDAEDATAGAFLELWRRRHVVRLVDGSVLPWLLVTTGNICRNLARGLGRYRAMIGALPRGTGPAASAEEEALGRAPLADVADRRLVTRLAELPRATRALVLLTAIEGYAVAEAAAAVGVSDGAARMRLSRARAALRDTYPEGASPATREGSPS